MKGDISFKKIVEDINKTKAKMKAIQKTKKFRIDNAKSLSFAVDDCLEDGLASYGICLDPEESHIIHTFIWQSLLNKVNHNGDREIIRKGRKGTKMKVISFKE
jgi:hypothetical protein